MKIIRWGVYLFLLAAAAIPMAVHGYTETTVGGVLGVSVVPFAPEPGQEVTIALDTTPASYEGATIRWMINGAPATQGVRGNTFTTRVGNIGTITRIQATVVRRADAVVTKTIEINPATVHILVSPFTYTTPGYRGAPEVSSGSEITLTAIPEMRTTAGNPVPLDEISFVWETDTDTLASGGGAHTTTLTAPESGATQEVRVRAEAQDGRIVAIRSVRLTPVVPRVAFYHEHPTLGTRYGEILERQSFVDEEVTVRAEPYFFSFGDVLDLLWSVNGESVDADARDTRLLTVRRASSVAAQALIDLVVENRTHAGQNARSSSVLRFRERDFRF